MAIDYSKNLTASNIQTPAPAVNVPDEFQKKLGSGLSNTFTRGDHQNYNLKFGVANILQEITVVMTTPVGRRWDQPDFGSMIYYLLMEQKTGKLKDELIQATEESLKAWVPSIIVEQVDVDYSSLNVAIVLIQFVIKGTLSREVVEIKLTMGDNQVFSASIFTHNGIKFFG